MSPKLAISILKLSKDIPIIGLVGEQIVKNQILGKGDDALNFVEDLLLRDPDSEIREIGIEIASKIDNPRAVGLLCEALRHDRDTGVQYEAAKALGQVSDGRAVEALTIALNRRAEVKQPWVVPERAAKSLGEIVHTVPEANNPEVVKSLIVRLNSGHYQLVDQCHKTLKQITRKSFGKNYDEWNQWFQENE